MENIIPQFLASVYIIINEIYLISFNSVRMGKICTDRFYIFNRK